MGQEKSHSPHTKVVDTPMPLVATSGQEVVHSVSAARADSSDLLLLEGMRTLVLEPRNQ